MKSLIISDTHEDENNALPYIIEEAISQGVKQVIHCGDINPKHVSKELFGNLPVVCALVDGQCKDPFFVDNCPDNWIFTRTGERFVTLIDGTRAYVGHKRPMDALRKTEAEFNAILDDLRMQFDGLRWIFGGHLHLQALQQSRLVTFMNGGSVGQAMSCTYEYAIIDTDTGEVIFSRILPEEPPESEGSKPLSVGIISDSLHVSRRSSTYWGKLAAEFKRRGVKHIIHCGNIALPDIGRPELSDFTVHYAICGYQEDDYRGIEKIPDNWNLLAGENPDSGAVVDIEGYRFFVQLDLGLKYVLKNDQDMDAMGTEIRRLHPETEFVLCGFTHKAMFFEGEQVMTINPGDVLVDRSFAVLTFPKREITFGHIPYGALPPLKKKAV